MIEAIVGLVSGVVSGMGIGGGSILILYLTLFAGMAQQQAQGINLLYFLPTAASALVVHVKNKAIDYKLTLVCALSGILTAALTQPAGGKHGWRASEEAICDFYPAVGLTGAIFQKGGRTKGLR